MDICNKYDRKIPEARTILSTAIYQDSKSKTLSIVLFVFLIIKLSVQGVLKLKRFKRIEVVLSLLILIKQFCQASKIIVSLQQTNLKRLQNYFYILRDF